MSSTSKLLIAMVVLVVGGTAWYGYSKQAEQLKQPDSAPVVAAAPDAEVFKPQPGDIVIGNDNAPITLIDYASLSCPHCAHFHLEVLPTLKKEYIDTGKVKFVYRHFPLNAPALRAAELVDCADPAQREKFLNVLFKMQEQWAANENYQDALKQIAAVGGIDSARFDSCISDAADEARIVETRKKGADEAKVDGTPALFINGVKLDGAPDVDTLRKALDSAAK